MGLLGQLCVCILNENVKSGVWVGGYIVSAFPNFMGCLEYLSGVYYFTK